MKLYNPFKSHLVTFEPGIYGIRKLSFLGWLYRDMDKECKEKPPYWWSGLMYASRAVRTDDLDFAKQLLNSPRFESTFFEG